MALVSGDRAFDVSPALEPGAIACAVIRACASRLFCVSCKKYCSINESSSTPDSAIASTITVRWLNTSRTCMLERRLNSGRGDGNPVDCSGVAPIITTCSLVAIDQFVPQPSNGHDQIGWQLVTQALD